MNTSIIKPEVLKFFGINVYLANDLLKYDPNFFYGCSSSIRKIIDKKKIPETDYFYGSLSKSGWKKCSETYPKSKLLLKEEWVYENMPKMANNVSYDIDHEMVIKLIEWKNKYELLQEKYQKDTDYLKKENLNLVETFQYELEIKEKLFQSELERYKIELQLRDERITSIEKIRELEHKLFKSKGIDI